MSRVTYAEARLAEAEARRLEEERRRQEEENRRKAIRAELRRLRGRLETLASETADLAKRAERLGGEAAGHPAAAPALGAFEYRRRALEALMAGFPDTDDEAGAEALARTREQAQRLLSAAESQLRALKAYLPHVEEGVAEARRQSFEARVFTGIAVPAGEKASEARSAGRSAAAPRQAERRAPAAAARAGTERACPAAAGGAADPAEPPRPGGGEEGEAPSPSPQDGRAEEERPAAEDGPAGTAEALAALAREAAAVRGVLAELDADLPPEMRPEVEDLARAVWTFAAMRDSPRYAAAQLVELGRQLGRHARRVAERREERDRMKATMAGAMEELRALAAARSGSPDAAGLEAALAEGVALAERPWPEPAEVERWLDQTRSLAGLARSRFEKDAHRRRVLDLVRDALAELGYEALTDPAPARPMADAPLEQVFLSPHGGGVSVSVAGDGAVLSEVVRFVEPGSETAEPTPVESDRLARQTRSWCEDYTAMVRRMQERGVVRLEERWRDENEPARPRVMPAPKGLKRKAGAGTRQKRRQSGRAAAGRIRP